jgi:hypothetical protein
MSYNKDMEFSNEKNIFTKTSFLQDTERKVCSVCNNALLYEFFYKNRSKKDGHESYCKDCAKIRRKAKRGRKSNGKRTYHIDEIVFEGIPDEKIFVSKLKPLIEELLHGQ